MTIDQTHAKSGDHALWDEDLWDELFAFMERQQVVPVVGPGLSIVEVDGRSLTIDQYVAEQLAERLALSLEDLPHPPSLGDVVARHWGRTGQDSGLYAKVNNILAKAKFEPSESLKQLARITHFKLFVTTTVDSLLETAIDEARFGGEARTKSIGYVPNDVCDLSSGLRGLTTPTVYHLLGKPSAIPTYVISEGDLLEYIYALQSDRRPERLFDELKNNNLLFLGGNFSDWLVRLFLRLTKGQRLSDPRQQLEILADERSRNDPALVSFLENFSSRTKVFNASGPAFIAELWRRWSERFGDQVDSGPRRPVNRTIFISYARQDEQAAKKIRFDLEARGFEIWFDADRLSGVEYDDAIKRAIKTCAVFMPLISKNTEFDVKDAYFRREWHLAEERDTRNAASVRFILPLMVDETSRAVLEHVPDAFLRKDIQKAIGGEVTEPILRALQSALEALN